MDKPDIVHELFWEFLNGSVMAESTLNYGLLVYEKWTSDGAQQGSPGSAHGLGPGLWRHLLFVAAPPRQPE